MSLIISKIQSHVAEVRSSLMEVRAKSIAVGRCTVPAHYNCLRDVSNVTTINTSSRCPPLGRKLAGVRGDRAGGRVCEEAGQ